MLIQDVLWSKILTSALDDLDDGPLPNFLDSTSSLSTSTLHRQQDRLRVGVESGVMNVEVPQIMGRSWVFPKDDATENYSSMSR